MSIFYSCVELTPLLYVLCAIMKALVRLHECADLILLLFSHERGHMRLNCFYRGGGGRGCGFEKNKQQEHICAISDGLPFLT